MGGGRGGDEKGGSDLAAADSFRTPLSARRATVGGLQFPCCVRARGGWVATEQRKGVPAAMCGRITNGYTRPGATSSSVCVYRRTGPPTASARVCIRASEAPRAARDSGPAGLCPSRRPQSPASPPPCPTPIPTSCVTLQCGSHASAAPPDPPHPPPIGRSLSSPQCVHSPAGSTITTAVIVIGSAPVLVACRCFYLHT